MKLLLDTHLLIWSAWTPKRVSPAAHALIKNPDNELFFSAASLWEIAIKQSLEKDDFQVDALLLRRGLFENDYSELPVSSDHAIATRALPHLHKDPFDRLLIAKATVEGITLLTVDKIVARYPGPIKKV
ncbi:MAG: type II toxin-antitoxin system VapC family toxin [Edaphobacter sp.]